MVQKITKTLWSGKPILPQGHISTAANLPVSDNIYVLALALSFKLHLAISEGIEGVVSSCANILARAYAVTTLSYDDTPGGYDHSIGAFNPQSFSVGVTSVG
jgi:hypothetical protein